MQSLAVFSPPESVNASSEQDIIRGGVSDLNDFLARYDHNENDVKDIYSAVGISRMEIVAAKPGTIKPADNTYVMSRYGQLSSSNREISLSYQRSTGGTGIRYFSPLSALSESNHAFKGWIGHSAILGWFGIVQANGSLATHGVPTTFTPSGSDATQALKKVSSQNLSQGEPSNKVSAKPLDKILYTLRLSNPHATTVSGDFNVRIADILEYSTLIDTGGGAFSQDNGALKWPSVELTPGETEERTFVVQMLSSLPSISDGTSNPESYNCRLSVIFGNTNYTKVSCPPVKEFESTLNLLPAIGTTGAIIFSTVLFAVALFLAARTRQLKKELRIIRHNFNTGSI